MKKRIILDRFRSENVSNFFEEFKNKNFEVQIITFVGETKISLNDYYGELIKDIEVSKGFFKKTPWVLDTRDLEFLSQHEGLFHDLLSRFALSPSYWASHEMSTHALLLCNYWKFK